MTDAVWKKYLTDYNEGLGLVYERFVLNDYLDTLANKYAVETVLEAPLYGMAGVSGINSVALARRGCAVTLVDDNAERLDGVKRIWSELELPARFVHQPDMGALPFADDSFDLAWEWAGLWYLPDAAALLRELVRVSRRLVFVAMPNPWQVGYLMRKYVVEPEFYRTIDERWVNTALIKRTLRGAGAQIIGEGVLDVPPWPDTVMPAADFLRKLGIRSERVTAQFQGEGWHWSTMDYYLGKRPELKARIDKYTFLEHLPVPWQLKLIWAHHHYVLAMPI